MANVGQVPRRVLMTADTVGGVWTFAVELAEALGAHGIEVILATLGGEPSTDQQKTGVALPNVQLLNSRYKLEWMDHPWADVEASGKWLLDLEKQFAPDLIHLNSYGHGVVPFEAPVLLTAHSCVLSWWTAVKGGAAPANWDRYRHAVETAFRSANLLVTPSRDMLRMLQQSYDSRDLPPCRVIPNGRSSAKYKPAPKDQFVLTAGRLWDEAKNIEAVAQVAPELPWSLYIAGENRHPNGQRVEFENCRMLGQLPPENLARLYGRAAIYALPARYEPFGLSALEAALSGCALVLGDIESLHEVWEDAAVFVHPDDSHQLASALRKLMEDRTLREELARRSMARAFTFTPERMANSYVEAYREVAGLRRMACAS